MVHFYLVSNLAHLFLLTIIEFYPVSSHNQMKVMVMVDYCLRREGIAAAATSAAISAGPIAFRRESRDWYLGSLKLSYQRGFMINEIPTSD